MAKFPFLVVSAVTVASVPSTTAGNGHLLTPALIGGQGPYPIILDTGADATGVYQWFAEQNKLTQRDTHDVEGMTGTVNSPSYAIPSITIDGLRVDVFSADSYRNRKDSEKQAAVVGNDFMDLAIAVFDYPCHEVSIWPLSTQERKLISHRAVKIIVGVFNNDSQLTFPFKVGSVTGVAVLDTGARQTKLDSEFSDAIGLNVSGPSFKDGEMIYGANSKGMPTDFGLLEPYHFQR